MFIRLATDEVKATSNGSLCFIYLVYRNLRYLIVENATISLGGSPGLVVMGRDSWSVPMVTGSNPCTIYWMDIFTYICFKNFFEKTANKWQKRPGLDDFFKKHPKSRVVKWQICFFVAYVNAPWRYAESRCQFSFSFPLFTLNEKNLMWPCEIYSQV